MWPRLKSRGDAVARSFEPVIVTLQCGGGDVAVTSHLDAQHVASMWPRSAERGVLDEVELHPGRFIIAAVRLTAEPGTHGAVDAGRRGASKWQRRSAAETPPETVVTSGPPESFNVAAAREPRRPPALQPPVVAWLATGVSSGGHQSSAA